MYEPLNISLACSFNCIETYKKQIKAIDKAIEKALNGVVPEAVTILESIPGIGPVCAAGIIAGHYYPPARDKEIRYFNLVTTPLTMLTIPQRLAPPREPIARSKGNWLDEQMPIAALR